MQRHVKAWIYGHTHNAAVTAIGKTITACNARGYPNESVPGFGRDVFMEFKTSSGEEEAGDEELYLAAATPLSSSFTRARGRSDTICSTDADEVKEDVEFM